MTASIERFCGRQSTQGSLHLVMRRETQPWTADQTIWATSSASSSSGAQQPARDRLADRPQDEGVGVLVAIADLDRALVGGVRRVRGHEHQAVVIGVAQREVGVGEPGGPQARDRVGDLGDLAEARRELEEVGVAERVDDRLLVAEVEVDRGRRVLDRRGDLPHRHRLVALLDEERPRRVEDLGPHLFLLALPAFLHSHERASET